MSWFRIWKRRRDREDLSEFKALLATPDAVASFPGAAQEQLVLPGPGKVAFRPVAATLAGDFDFGTGDGFTWTTPALDAGQIFPLGLIEEGETLTITNSGTHTGVVEVGVLDNFGRFRTIWTLTCV